MTEGAYPDALPAGYKLHWYVLESVLGQGGFGITYLARDTNLDRRVAIKEYLPSEFAHRVANSVARPRTGAHAERFSWGLERFLLEARTLARFDHPNIVRVHSVFEANNSAYMVMRFEEGENLAARLERNPTLSESQLLGCLLPILDGLQLVHDAGFIHRDIKPENIYLRDDGSSVLLDFGSARQSFGSTKTMTILVAPGYAPLEQYYGGAETQGPWTDIYGLGASCYRAITGHAPLDAVTRAKNVLGSASENLKSALDIGRGRYREQLLVAVDHALQLNERDRPQSIADWRREIVATQAPRVNPSRDRSAAPHAALPGRVNLSSSDRPAAPSGRLHMIWGAGVAGALLLAGGAYFLWPRPAPQMESTATTASAPTGSQATASTIAANDAARAVNKAVEVAEIATAAIPTKEAARVDRPSRGEPRVPPAQPGKAAHNLVASTPAAPSQTTPVVVLPVTATPTASSSPATALAVAASAAALVSEANERRRARDQQLDSAEAAIRRGDLAAAADMLTPLAAAGLPRAQTLLGRVQESRGQQQGNFMQAYMWYSIAARGGDAGAAALRTSLAGKLQPADIRQAEHLAESWKPRAEPVPAATDGRPQINAQK